MLSWKQRVPGDRDKWVVAVLSQGHLNHQIPLPTARAMLSAVEGSMGKQRVHQAKQAAAGSDHRVLTQPPPGSRWRSPGQMGSTGREPGGASYSLWGTEQATGFLQAHVS